jgi:small-conductance mechanosensitive channel
VGAQPEAVPHLRAKERLLAQLARTYRRERAALATVTQLARFFITDLDLRQAELPWLERVKEWGRALRGIWRWEVFAVDANSITVSTLVTALLLILLGFAVSRRLSRFLGLRLFPRLGLHAGASAALQTLLFYLLVLAFTLGALHMLNVPLTVFTVLGGAFAIGVGFGSQNIVNNFISGLILLIEQPIKVGDLIEVDGSSGRVERIGPRSTRVRTFANIHLIVPNSTFLEQNVVNWTLSDDMVRVKMSVGVAYGSPTREVETLLLQAMRETAGVEVEPAPAVFFADFGDSSLAFDLYLWLKVDSAVDMRRVQSDVRFRIDELCRARGISIAFPQRDVHLDTQKPLEVRVLPAAPPLADPEARR